MTLRKDLVVAGGLASAALVLIRLVSVRFRDSRHSRNSKSCNAEYIVGVRYIMSLYPTPWGLPAMSRHYCQLFFSAPFLLTYRFLGLLPPGWVREIFRRCDESFGNVAHSVVARTHFFDQVVREGVSRESHAACQVVLLGAGYDDRLYRLFPLLSDRGVVCFEVDRPIVQEDKIRRLKEDKSAMPHFLFEGVRFVPVDFNSGEKLDAKLLAAGFDKKKKTVFLLEGVTMYLSVDGIRETFGALHGLMKCSTEKSSLSFDFLERKVVESKEDPNIKLKYSMKEQARTTALRGAPFTHGFDPSEFEAEMNEFNFRVAAMHSPSETRKQFLPPQTSGYGLKGIDWEYFHLTTVEVLK